MTEKYLNHKDRKGHKGRAFSFALWSLCALWFMLLFAACVPAVTPPILSATPGEAVTVTDNTYANDRFSLTYPTGWRVITSPTDAPPSVTLVAPGDCALIIAAAAPVDPPDCAGSLSAGGHSERNS